MKQSMLPHWDHEQQGEKENRQDKDDLTSVTLIGNPDSQILYLKVTENWSSLK